MREKIIIFLIGLLLGAIIATGSIYCYTLANNSNKENTMEVPNGDFRPNGQMNGTPPEMPSGEMPNQVNS